MATHRWWCVVTLGVWILLANADLSTHTRESSAAATHIDAKPLSLKVGSALTNMPTVDEKVQIGESDEVQSSTADQTSASTSILGANFRLKDTTVSVLKAQGHECGGKEISKGYLATRQDCVTACKGTSKFIAYGRHPSRCKASGTCACLCENPGENKCEKVTHSGYNVFKLVPHRRAQVAGCVKSGGSRDICKYVYDHAESQANHIANKYNTVAKFKESLGYSASMCVPSYSNLVGSVHSNPYAKCYETHAYQFVRSKTTVLWMHYSKATCSADKKTWSTMKFLVRCFTAPYSNKAGTDGYTTKECVIYGVCRYCNKVKINEVGCADASVASMINGFTML